VPIESSEASSRHPFAAANFLNPVVRRFMSTSWSILPEWNAERSLPHAYLARAKGEEQSSQSILALAARRDRLQPLRIGQEFVDFKPDVSCFS
jgi:hypothetical protein